MEKTEPITHIRSISEYNDLFGIETLHPLVTVIDFSKCPLVRHTALCSISTSSS